MPNTVIPKPETYHLTPEERQKLIIGMRIALTMLDPQPGDFGIVTHLAYRFDTTRPTCYAHAKRVLDGAVLSIRQTRRVGRPTRAEREQRTLDQPILANEELA